jgi:hypothetical protein
MLHEVFPLVEGLIIGIPAALGLVERKFYTVYLMGFRFASSAQPGMQ